MAAKNTTKEHSEALIEQLNEFRMYEEFIDVILICNDKSISAHKNVLAASSPYFRAMFSGGSYLESKEKKINMQDLNAECLQMIIDYIYTGSLDITDDCVQELFMTASFLLMDHVMDLCANYMAKRLDINNCLDFKRFAEKQQNICLLEAAKFFIAMHITDVCQSADFIEMSYDELNDLLNKDKSYVLSDDVVLAILSRWTEHCPSERLPHLVSLLAYIHPTCVSAEVARSLPILHEVVDSYYWLGELLDAEAKLEWCIFLLDKMGQNGDLQRFELSFDVATQLQSIPRAAFAYSLTAYKNLLYVQGGSAKRSTRECYSYNIYRDEWDDLNPLLVERSHHRSLVLDECLYALGGNTLQGATSTVECLNLLTNKTEIKTNMMTERSSMGAVVCENCIYVMGGEKDHRSLFSAERYDPRIGLWYALPSMRDVNSYCTSAVIGQNIYCCEGLGNCMERYDLRANKWVAIDFWEEREFYEIFTVDNNLFSISGEAISRFNITECKWYTEYKFPENRAWDTAAGLKVLNYSH